MAQDETKLTALDLSQGISLDQLADGKIEPASRILNRTTSGVSA